MIFTTSLPDQKEDTVMINATNRENENLAAQEDSIMENSMHQAHENSVRAFMHLFPTKS